MATTTKTTTPVIETNAVIKPKRGSLNKPLAARIKEQLTASVLKGRLTAEEIEMLTAHLGKLKEFAA